MYFVKILIYFERKVFRFATRTIHAALLGFGQYIAVTINNVSCFIESYLES
jgi:hypothetical protein